MARSARRAVLTMLVLAASTVATSPGAYADPSPTPTASSSPASATAADGTLSGTITDATTGRPVDQAFVWLSTDTGARGPSVVTGADGRYSLAAPAGTWRISVGASLPQQLWAYVQRVVGGPTPESSAVPVSLTPGATTVSDIALTPAGRLSGTVVDQAGHPVTSVWVEALDARGNLVSSGLSIRPPKDGTVTLWVLSPVRLDVRFCAWPDPAPPGGDAGSPTCSPPVSIAPQQVVSGVRLVVATASASAIPTHGPGAACTSGCADALAKSGSGSALGSAGAGLAALLLGTGLVAATRRRPSPRSGAHPATDLDTTR